MNNRQYEQPPNEPLLRQMTAPYLQRQRIPSTQVLLRQVYNGGGYGEVATPPAPASYHPSPSSSHMHRMMMMRQSMPEKATYDDLLQRRLSLERQLQQQQAEAAYEYAAYDSGLVSETTSVVTEEEEVIQQSCEEDSKPATKKEKKPTTSPKKKKQNEKWLASLETLRKYKEEYGDCIVPRGFPLNPHLASWVAEQRKQFKLMKDGKQSSITPERIALLNELGFAWNAQEAAWEKHLVDLKRYKDEYGDCVVPLNHDKYPKLGLWVKEQRRHCTLMKQGKKSHMTEERARVLDDIGFCWDTHENVWGERLRELCQYKAEHGHCVVPTNYRANSKLGTWVHHQRRQYKKFMDGQDCHITEERIRALDSLGFVWNPRDRSQSPTTTEESLTSSSDVSGSKRGVPDLDFKPSKRRRL